MKVVKFLRTLAFAVVWLSASSAPLMAAEAVERGNEILIRGNLEVGDLSRLDLSTRKTIVFEYSLGGTYAAALDYIDAIQKNRLDTMVRGKCFSACAMAFLAGKKRSVDTRGWTMSTLSFHAARVVTATGVRPGSRNEQLAAEIDRLAGGKITPEVLALIASSWTESAGVVFVFYPRFLFLAVRGTLYCDGTQGSDLSKCRKLGHADAYELGIVTAD